MTLRAFIALFHSQTGGKGNDSSNQLAVELLNAGWRHAAEDTLGLKTYYYDTLIQGQSEYVLPECVIKVHKVRLLDGRTLKAEMVPGAPEDILSRDGSGEVTPGVPTACSVARMKYRDGEAGTSLRFNCPPNWGTITDTTDQNENIEVYCTCTAGFLKDLSREPDLPHSLGQAGLWWACLLTTGEGRFYSLYKEERDNYLRSGVGNEPRAMGKPGFGGRHEQAVIEGQ